MNTKIFTNLVKKYILEADLSPEEKNQIRDHLNELKKEIHSTGRCSLEDAKDAIALSFVTVKRIYSLHKNTEFDEEISGILDDIMPGNVGNDNEIKKDAKKLTKEFKKIKISVPNTVIPISELLEDTCENFSWYSGNPQEWNPIRNHIKWYFSAIKPLGYVHWQYLQVIFFNMDQTYHFPFAEKNGYSDKNMRELLEMLDDCDDLTMTADWIIKKTNSNLAISAEEIENG